MRALTFTLTVVCSADGYIARAPDDPPQAWASAEEQDLFFRDVEAADWAIMGRNTHEADDKLHRRRIIFSTKLAGWRRPTQLWIDPASLAAGDLPTRVAAIHPLRNGLILGGTRVHDWFLAQRAIHRVHLTVEPVRFGAGLPVFSEQRATDPLQVFRDAGFEVITEQRLNANGTRYFELEPADSAAG